MDYHTKRMAQSEGQKIQRLTVVHQVMEQIRSMIASGEYQPGDRLPTEQQLAERFGLGRSTIREAIKIFNYLGILESRTARGTYICDRTSISAEALTWSVLLGTRELSELIEIRGALELWSILRFTEAVGRQEEGALQALEQLRRLVEKMRQAGSDRRDEGRIDADYEFHQIIIMVGGNSVFSSIYSTLRSFMKEEISRSQDKYPDPRVIAEEHQTIVDALGGGNPAEAERVCLGHIENIKQRIL